MEVLMRTFVLIFVALASSPAAFADDWPQWLGPQRDGIWRETGIIEKFPKDGPKVLWRTPINEGYSGPAVTGGKVYITDYIRAKNIDAPKGGFDKARFSGVERVLCLDEKTGSILWTHEYPTEYDVGY